MFRPFALLVVASLAVSSIARGQDAFRDAGSLPPHVARDDGAPPVTEANLLESERFWPYRVKLTGRDMASNLPLESEGVLIRVEEKGRLRIDFGRDGVRTVPVGITNVVDAANAVRTGALTKMAPNLALAIGPRLNGDALGIGRVPFGDSTARRGFLAVFADPEGEEFEAIAKSLAPLQSHDGVATVLFPQRLVNGDTFGTRLAALGWKIAYVYDYLVPGYTEALVGKIDAPIVSLHTAEGRLLFERPWTPETAAELAQSVERNFPAAPRAKSASNLP